MRKVMSIVIYISAILYLLGSAILAIAVLRKHKKPVAQPKQEPDPLWVLHVEEALSEL
jgi:hypothetical protein